MPEPGWTAIILNAALIALLVALSGAYAGSEPILFSLSRMQIQHFAASTNPFRRLTARVLAEPRRTLAVILLGNTAVNVLLYASTYVLFARLEHRLGVWAGVIPAVFSILVVSVCGEAIPKTLGVALKNRLAPYSAALVHFSGYALGPVSRVLDVAVIEPLNRLLLGQPRHQAVEPHDLSNMELKTLLEMSRRQGMIDPVEDAFLREVVDLGLLRVRDVMVPRVEVKAYDVDAPAAGLRTLMRSARLKKIPVYAGTVDNIIGLVYAKVLFLNPHRTLRELVVPVRFVPALATCEHLLQHFRQTRTQIAIAVDEYGGMAGLVTLEDVLEAIVGDIQTGEQPVEEPEIVPISDDEYDVSGQLHVHYWSQWFGLPRLSERVATVGGLVTARLGRPARVGDTVRFANLELRVTAVKGRRVDRLRLHRLAPADSEHAAAPPRPEESR